MKVMKEIILQHLCEDGEWIQASFLPAYGMNLTSLKKGDVEVIDQSTRPAFEQRFNGLGPLIGPHFYHRKEDEIPQVPDETIFPHIARVKKMGGVEPFSHGIGRYVPWRYKATESSIEGNISGEDTYHGITLTALEGFDFSMHFKATLTERGIDILLDVLSEKHPSIAGLHYYFALGTRKNTLRMQCNPLYNDLGEWKEIPKRWLATEPHQLAFDLDEESDFGFIPLGKQEGEAELETDSHTLRIHYQTASDEHAFQLYHPKGASFACVEPVTAKNPRAAKQKENHLTVSIEIL